MSSDFKITDIPHFRDFCAVSALSFLGHPAVLYNETPEWVAKKAYAIADAMLKERSCSNVQSFREKKD